MTAAKGQKLYGWYIAIISAFIGVSMTASFPQFTMVVETYAAKLGTTQEFLLFTDTLRSAAIMVAMLISGPVYRKLGLKKTFVLAMATMIVPQVLFPFVTSPIMVLVLKVTQGFCAATFPIFLIIIMGWMERSNVGLATAVFNGIFYGGAGIGGMVAGKAITNFGWVESFYAVAIMALVPAVLWFFTVKENPVALEVTGNEKGGNFVNEQGHSLSQDSQEKIFPLMLRDYRVWGLVICLFSTIWMVQVLSVDLPLYGSYLEYGAEEVGLFMTSLSIGIFVACVASGKASDYFAGRSRNPGVSRLMVFSFGPVLTILSVFLILAIDKNNFMLFYATVLLLAFASAWGLGSFYCILPELLDKRMINYATGFIGGIGDAGMPLGPLVFGVWLGVRGLWGAAWVSCIVMSLISLLGSILLMAKIRGSKSK